MKFKILIMVILIQKIKFYNNHHQISAKKVYLYSQENDILKIINF